MYTDYVHLHDKKGSGVDGGDSVLGAWRTRDLTDEVSDDGNLCTLAANQFTLELGTYRILASASSLAPNLHQTRLYNITDMAMELLGSSCWNRGSILKASTISIISGRFTIAAQKTFEVQHQVEANNPGDGWGKGNSWGDNIYTTVELWKEGSVDTEEYGPRLQVI